MKGSIKEKLLAGEVVFGQMVMEFFTPGLPYLLAKHGLDYALFDMEHGRCDLAQLSEMVFVSRAAGIAPLVRVPDVAFAPLSRVLDIGVAGVMVPRVETPEQMSSIVSALKYAPQGKRGVALGFAHDKYNNAGPAYLAQANDATLVIALLETAAAFERLDEIVATPGLDVAWMGHYDLTVSLGIPAQFEHPLFLECMDRLVESCRRRNVAPGYLPATAEDARHWVSRGFRMISVGSDLGTYESGLRSYLDGLTAES